MDFTSALTQKADEVARPAALPTGYYIWSIAAVAEQEEFESSRTGDTFTRLRIPMTCVSPHDVDEEDLAAFGNVSGQRLFKTFLFNTNPEKQNELERSIYNLKRFLVDHCQLDESKTLEELLHEGVGAQCLGEVTHRTDPNDPEIVYAELGRTAQVD